MPSARGTWLTGLASAGVGRGAHRGHRLGLPEDGPGSVAGYGRRAAAFLLDVLTGALMGGLVNGLVHHPDPVARSLAVDGAFVLEVVVLTLLTGQSLGMRLVGLRVLALAAPERPPGLRQCLVRTALLVLVVPALIGDRDGRGLHDRAAGTVVVRA